MCSNGGSGRAAYPVAAALLFPEIKVVNLSLRQMKWVDGFMGDIGETAGADVYGTPGTHSIGEREAEAPCLRVGPTGAAAGGWRGPFSAALRS